MNDANLSAEQILALMDKGLITSLHRVNTDAWRACDSIGVAVTSDWRLSEGETPAAAVTNLYRLITTQRLLGGETPNDLFKQI